MANSLQRIAVTGGSGFIGRHFCRRFDSEGRLHSILDLHPPVYPVKSARVVVGDVRDPEAVRKAVRGADSVLHLAAAHHDSGIADETFFSVNEQGARTLCNAMEQYGIRNICFFSTVAVYGTGPDTRETARCMPDSPYGRSKLAGESVFRDWAQQRDDRSVLIIRPTVTFGPWHFANMYNLIRQIASRLYVQVGAGGNRKSLVYVDNVVRATLHLWPRMEPGSVDVFNAVDKPDLTSGEISEAIHGCLGRSGPWLRLPMGLSRILVRPLDGIATLTGWEFPVSSDRLHKFAEAETVFSGEKLACEDVGPRVPLEEGIRRMVDWYMREGRDLAVNRSLPPAEPMSLAVGAAD